MRSSWAMPQRIQFVRDDEADRIQFVMSARVGALVVLYFSPCSKMKSASSVVEPAEAKEWAVQGETTLRGQNVLSSRISRKRVVENFGQIYSQSTISQSFHVQQCKYTARIRNPPLPNKQIHHVIFPRCALPFASARPTRALFSPPVPKLLSNKRPPANLRGVRYGGCSGRRRTEFRAAEHKIAPAAPENDACGPGHPHASRFGVRERGQWKCGECGRLRRGGRRRLSLKREIRRGGQTQIRRGGRRLRQASTLPSVLYQKIWGHFAMQGNVE